MIFFYSFLPSNILLFIIAPPLPTVDIPSVIAFERVSRQPFFTIAFSRKIRRFIPKVPAKSVEKPTTHLPYVLFSRCVTTNHFVKRFFVFLRFALSLLKLETRNNHLFIADAMPVCVGRVVFWRKFSVKSVAAKRLMCEK